MPASGKAADSGFMNDRLDEINTSLGQVTDVYAAKYGVKADNSTDNTAALLALANQFRTDTNGPAGSHRRVRIHLSEKGITRGHLPWAPGIVWCDGELRPPTAGATKHLVYPIDGTWLGNGGARWGDGAHRAGLMGITINGERGTGPNLGSRYIKPIPTGLACTAAPGSLPSGTYAYQIAYKTSFGIGEASQPVHMWGPGTGATLTWDAGDSYSEVVVFGRSPWQTYGQYKKAQEDGDHNSIGRRILAVLPPGTTTWTDDGSATPYGTYAMCGDLSAPGVVLVGADTIVKDVRIMEVEGTGLYSEWMLPWEGSIPGEPWYSGMEASVNGLRIEGTNGPGLVWVGPHDSHITDVTCAGTGSGDGSGTADLRNALHIAGMGPVSVTNVHVWGTHRYGMALESPCRVIGGASEGAAYAQVLVNAGETFVGGGLDVFFPNGSTSVGISVGRDAINGGDASMAAPAHISGVNIRGFGRTSGPAVDLTYAGRTYLAGIIDQSDMVTIPDPADSSKTITVPNGIKVKGLDPAKHNVELINIASDGSHVVNRLS